MAPRTVTVRRGDTLSKIAQAQGVGIGDITGFRSGDPNKIFPGEVLSLSTPKSVPSPLDISSFTPAQQKAFADANKLGAGVQTIGANQLNGEPTAPTLPPQPQAPQTDFAGVLSALDTQTQDQKDAQSKQAGILGNIEGILARQGQEAQRRTQLEAGLNVPELNKQLNEINQQIRTVASDAFAATQNAENRLAPTFAIQGEKAAIERQKSVKLFGLSAASQALQGNIALAKDFVDKAIQSEFEPLTKALEFQKIALDLNRDLMTSAQKKKADKLAILIDERNRQLKEKAQEKSDIYDIMLTAAKNGADNTTLNSILNSDTKEGALSVANTAGAVVKKTKPVKVTQAEKDAELKIAINKQIATPEFQNATEEEQRAYIRSQGADPFNFGF